MWGVEFVGEEVYCVGDCGVVGVDCVGSQWGCYWEFGLVDGDVLFDFVLCDAVF